VYVCVCAGFSINFHTFPLFLVVGSGWASLLVYLLLFALLVPPTFNFRLCEKGKLLSVDDLLCCCCCCRLLLLEDFMKNVILTSSV